MVRRGGNVRKSLILLGMVSVCFYNHTAHSQAYTRKPLFLLIFFRFFPAHSPLLALSLRERAAILYRQCILRPYHWLAVGCNILLRASVHAVFRGRLPLRVQCVSVTIKRTLEQQPRITLRVGALNHHDQEEEHLHR